MGERHVASRGQLHLSLASFLNVIRRSRGGNRSSSSDSSSSNPLHNRRIVGGFILGDVLGVGTYGEVCVGYELATGRVCALKIVDTSRHVSETVHLLLREMQLLLSLDHPRVIALHSVKHSVPLSGTFCSQCGCTMCVDSLGRPVINIAHAKKGQRCKSCQHSVQAHSSWYERQVVILSEQLALGGEMFSMLMHCGRYPEPLCAHLFRQLLTGLQYIHEQGLCHRDLKPENLVFDANFNLQIVDFGLACLVEQAPQSDEVPDILELVKKKGSQGSDASAASSDAGQAMEEDEDGGSGDAPPRLIKMHSGVGSLPYTAPEVYYNKPVYDSRGYDGVPADVWSCGVILFVMLTGRPPFMRPLLKNYPPKLAADKHFINFMNHNAFHGLSSSVIDILKAIFQVEPTNRPSVSQLLAHPWLKQADQLSQAQISSLLLKRFKRVCAVDRKVTLSQLFQACTQEKQQQEASSDTESSKDTNGESDDDSVFDMKHLEQPAQSMLIQKWASDTQKFEDPFAGASFEN